jgi:hypothetical protein
MSEHYYEGKIVALVEAHKLLSEEVAYQQKGMGSGDEVEEAKLSAKKSMRTKIGNMIIDEVLEQK